MEFCGVCMALKDTKTPNSSPSFQVDRELAIQSKPSRRRQMSCSVNREVRLKLTTNKIQQLTRKGNELATVGKLSRLD
jgi:hypothetical protein